MADSRLLEELAARLKAKSIYDLRQVARQVGVPRPTEGRKERITEEILNIASGKSDPASQSASGAPPKSAEYDRQLVVDILRCREINLSSFENERSGGITMQVSSSAVSNEPCEGFLYKADGVWYLNSTAGEVFVSDSFISKFSLREGDYLKGALRRKSDNGLAGLVTVSQVDGVIPEALSDRLDFESFAPTYPVKRLSATRGQNDIASRMIDLLSPVAAGQRALVVAPHGTGKTGVLKGIAQGIEKNHPEAKIIIALIDARPEEAADFKRAFSRADVLTSTMDAGARVHIKTAELALEYAKRQAELKRDVVFILDDLTKLTRAYNSGSLVASALDTSALDAAKKFISSARNTDKGASLTIISALGEGGDGIESAIYSGLKDACNMRVTLSQKLARFKVNPPIDIENTWASGDEKILSEEEQNASVAIRRKHEEGEIVIKLFESTASNGELCAALK
ncbi:MAG: hypothetical protein K2N22_07070 [Clostridia bacterium]|nr:hypothetical protein [Clostridia bacterium]